MSVQGDARAPIGLAVVLTALIIGSLLTIAIAIGFSIVLSNNASRSAANADVVTAQKIAAAQKHVNELDLQHQAATRHLSQVRNCREFIALDNIKHGINFPPRSRARRSTLYVERFISQLHRIVRPCYRIVRGDQR